ALEVGEAALALRVVQPPERAAKRRPGLVAEAEEVAALHERRHLGGGIFPPEAARPLEEPLARRVLAAARLLRGATEGVRAAAAAGGPARRRRPPAEAAQEPPHARGRGPRREEVRRQVIVHQPAHPVDEVLLGGEPLQQRPARRDALVIVARRAPGAALEHRA